MRSLGKIASLVLVLIFLILNLIVISQPATVKAQPKTIIVPDDYSTIQAAVDHASTGDTVFVKNGTYHENITVTKSIQLIGENPQNTTIVGYQSQTSGLLCAITVLSNSTITGFTVKDSQIGIYLDPATGFLGGSVLSCIFLNNTKAIEGRGDNIVISACSFIGNDWGLNLVEGSATISNNTILNNNQGLGFWHETFNVSSNTIAHNNQFGIEFTPSCFNCTVYNNNFTQNNLAIKLLRFIITYSDNIGINNTVYSNNFVDNLHQVAVVDATYAYNYSGVNGTDVVSWDNGKVGNYWSDYDGQGNYTIDENNVDHHPLTQQINISTTQPTESSFPLVNAVVASVGVFVSFVVFLLLYKRHRRTP